MFREHRVGGREEWFIAPPADANMLIADESRECVVYLGTYESTGTALEAVCWGTGFFVSVDHHKHRFTLFPYLVTAAHIVENHLQKRPAFVRINRKDGTAANVRLQQDARWYFHHDPTVDLAVLPLLPDPDVFRYRMMNSSSIVTAKVIKNRGIGAGDEVHIMGLFGYVEGKQRNIPIVRMGNVAMVPDDGELIPTDRGYAKAYLIEARSIGGISGSPVFVRESLWIEADPNRPFIAGDRSPRPDTDCASVGGKTRLFGVIHGHWDVPPSYKNTTALPPDDAEGVNIGIAVVTPAELILPILEHPELVALREREVGLLDQARTPRTD